VIIPSNNTGLEFVVKGACMVGIGYRMLVVFKIDRLDDGWMIFCLVCVCDACSVLGWTTQNYHHLSFVPSHQFKEFRGHQPA
jgi:hypothetical protein